MLCTGTLMCTAQHLQTSAPQMRLNNSETNSKPARLVKEILACPVCPGFRTRENKKGQRTEQNHFWMYGRWIAARSSLLIWSKRETTGHRQWIIREDILAFEVKKRQLCGALTVFNCLSSEYTLDTTESLGLLDPVWGQTHPRSDFLF